jgi:hypothetical protein
MLFRVHPVPVPASIDNKPGDSGLIGLTTQISPTLDEGTDIGGGDRESDAASVLTFAEIAGGSSAFADLAKITPYGLPEREIERLRGRSSIPLDVRVPLRSLPQHFYCITFETRGSRCVRSLRDLKTWRDAVLSPVRADVICIEDEMLLSEMRKDAALENAVLTQIAAWYDALKCIHAPIIETTDSGTITLAGTSPQDLRAEIDADALDSLASQRLAYTSQLGHFLPLLHKQTELMRIVLSARVGIVSDIMNRLLQQSNFRVTQEDRVCAISNSDIPFTAEVIPSSATVNFSLLKCFFELGAGCVCSFNIPCRTGRLAREDVHRQRGETDGRRCCRSCGGYRKSAQRQG